jgi:large subunit ribosomal protein L17
MHRHGYQGRKLHRERDQRNALIKGLADSLVKYESIETTLPKAKEVVPYLEKLITKAKKGDLHNRRQVLSGLQTVASAHKLVDEIAPKLGSRSSGHLRIVKTGPRRGDNSQLARVSFVDDLKVAPVAKAATTPDEPAKKPASTTNKSVKSTKPKPTAKTTKKPATKATKESK